MRAICDDVHLAGPDGDVAEAYAYLQTELERIGLSLRYGDRKTCCWSPSFPQVAVPAGRLRG